MAHLFSMSGGGRGNGGGGKGQKRAVKQRPGGEQRTAAGRLGMVWPSFMCVRAQAGARGTRSFGVRVWGCGEERGGGGAGSARIEAEGGGNATNPQPQEREAGSNGGLAAMNQRRTDHSTKHKKAKQNQTRTRTWGGSHRDFVLILARSTPWDRMCWRFDRSVDSSIGLRVRFECVVRPRDAWRHGPATRLPV